LERIPRWNSWRRPVNCRNGIEITIKRHPTKPVPIGNNGSSDVEAPDPRPSIVIGTDEYDVNDQVLAALARFLVERKAAAKGETAERDAA
jgi:hypothetical protein